MLNTAPAPDVARRPRGLVKVNGDVTPGWVSWEVDNNAYDQADTFRIAFAAAQLPAGRDAAWWPCQKTIAIEILAGLPGNPENFTTADLDSVIDGEVDEIHYDPVRGILDISGRDLTTRLSDAKTSEKFLNLTSSQIAERIAARHNLKAVVTKTTTPAGRYYEIDHNRFNDQSSEWELLTGLAHEEQFMVYVKGQTLYFRPLPTPGDDCYRLQWQPPTGERGYALFNGKTLRFSRNLMAIHENQVIVRSWNAKQKKRFVAAVPATAPADGRIYHYTIPGLDKRQTLRRAQALHQQIARHEMKLTAELPADGVLDVTRLIQVSGTGTAFDQHYYPSSVVRHMSASEGYTMTVDASNHAPAAGGQTP